MADRELRRMSRMELVEIIYALQQNERFLREENVELHKQLDDKLIRLEKAGSIAEAALSLNRIFEDADAAAKQYLASLRAATEEASQDANVSQVGGISHVAEDPQAGETSQNAGVSWTEETLQTGEILKGAGISRDPADAPMRSDEKAAEAEERLRQLDEKIAAAEERLRQTQERIPEAEERLRQTEENAAAAEERLRQTEEKAREAEERLRQSEEKCCAMLKEAEQEIQKKRQAFVVSVRHTLEKNPDLAWRMKKAADEQAEA